MFIAIAAIMLIAGAIFIINPFKNNQDITVFFGIVFSVYGLSNIMMSFWLRSEYAKDKNKIKKP